LACTRRLMGTILAAVNQQKQASEYFERASESFHQSGMRLAWARTLQSYGVALLDQHSPVQSDYAQGLKYLQDASQTFRECNANLDLQVVERVLARYRSLGEKVTKR